MLRDYFQRDLQIRALGVYSEFARKAHWPIPEILDLYDASVRSFHLSIDGEQAFNDFRQIYDALTGTWHALRPHGRRECWPPRQIFETIKREFSGFGSRGFLDLLNLRNREYGPRLESCLLKMQGMKPHQGFPVMAVSKFLHFYNPGLFPIYDYEVVWKKVFGRFRDEFQNFCSTAKITYDVGDTALFYRNYMCWGNSLLSGAHEKFMRVFVDWLGKQPGAKLSGRTFNPANLYATAFEFTAIGGAFS